MFSIICSFLGGTARVYALSDRRPWRSTIVTQVRTAELTCVENPVTYHQSEDHADEELHRVSHGDLLKSIVIDS